MKIAVIGTGYVGLVTGTCFADSGNDVTCVDIDERKIAMLGRGEIPIYEPGLAELVEHNLAADRLRFTTDLAATVANADVIFLAVGTPQSDSGAAVGGTAGGVSGAVAGGLIFGPIGAIIGGFTGAVIGASVVSDASVEYVRLHPTDPVIIEGSIDVGFVVPEDIVLHPIEDDPEYAYFYTNDRVFFVKLSDRTVVYSPGVVVAAKD